MFMLSVVYPQFLQTLLSSCPTAGEGVHLWLFKTARYLHAFHSPEEICEILEEKVARCGRVLESHEIPHAVKNSFKCRWIPGTGEPIAQEQREVWLANPISRPRPTPSFDPEMARETANRISTEITPEWLKARSPKSVNATLEQYLSEIFHSEEKVRLFVKYRSQGGPWPNPKVDFLQFSRTAWRDGVWFLCNPVDGQQHSNPRQQNKLSFRSQESVTDWRHAVLECDHEPKEVWKPIWLKILVQMPLPILSLIDSGNISIHALLRVPCKTKEEWDHFKAEKLSPLIKIGACSGSLSAVRLTRAPNCWRRVPKLRPQKLLYFNPEADGTPIIKRKVR
jgi:hypothetical protein